MFDSPEQHKWITEDELNYIKLSQEGKVTKTKVLYRAYLEPTYKTLIKIQGGSTI